MTSCKASSCRLCLKISTHTSFHVVDGVTRDILDILLLKLKFQSKGEEVICDDCRIKLNEALEFKSRCLNTDNTIIPHVDCEEMLLDLREIYMKETGKQLTSIPYNYKICRLCMQLIKGEMRCICEEELEAIQEFVPEMNIMIIKDPVVCEQCFDSLCIHNKFLKECLEVDQRISDMSENSVVERETDGFPSHTLIKTENSDKESENNEVEMSIKTECVDVKSDDDEERYLNTDQSKLLMKEKKSEQEKKDRSSRSLCVNFEETPDSGSENDNNLSMNINSEWVPDNVADKSERKIRSHSRHCCFFCKKQVFNVARHWKLRHSMEDEVKEILNSNQSSVLRRQMIDKLRRKGDFEYNKNGKEYIVSRKSKHADAVYLPCPSCLGYYNKKNLRKHKRKCSPNDDRSYRLQGDSRKLTRYIHEKACETLKLQIAPYMVQDEVTNEVYFDEILIMYGNYLCTKYTEDRLKNHIRSQLRLLGRFMLRIKTHDNSIKTCKELIHPKNISTVQKAVNDAGEFDRVTNIYKRPSNARALLSELKKLVQIVKSESDKSEDDDLKRNVEAFSHRIDEELAPYINRICHISEKNLRKVKRQNDSELSEKTGSKKENLTLSNTVETVEAVTKDTSQDEERTSKGDDPSAALTDGTTASRHLKDAIEKGTHKETNVNKSGDDDDDKRTRKRRKRRKYSTDDSGSDEELSVKEVESCIGKFTRRKLWTTLEKNTTRSFFDKEISLNKPLDPKKVRKFKEMHRDVMVHRSIPMIKQWVEGEKLKMKEEKTGTKEKQRPRYSTPERELLQSSTEHHSREGTEPSLQELEELISKNDIFKSRSADSLLRKYRFMQKQNK